MAGADPSGGPVTTAQWDVLDTIQRLGGATLRQIAEDTGRDQGTIGRMIGRMLHHKLVTRVAVSIPDGDYAYRYTCTGLVSEPDPAVLDMRRARWQVLDYMRRNGGEATMPAIVAALNRSKKTMYSVVMRAEKAGLIERAGRRKVSEGPPAIVWRLVVKDFPSVWVRK